MDWIKWLAVTAILIRAVYTDKKEGKIENRIILMGFVFGLFVSFADGGIQSLLESIKMAGITLLALFFLFVMKGLGAGDIKLFCVLATFFPKQIIPIVMLSFFAGAVLAVGKIFGRWLRKEKVFIRHETMNFSLPIALATEILLFLRYLVTIQ